MFTIDNEGVKKEERTESVWMYVTPAVKREFEMIQNNEKLREQIIRDHIKSETNWLKSEMDEIDESVIKYRGKLLTIKDKFNEAQDSYVEQIESISSTAYESFKKFDSIAAEVSNKVVNTYDKIKQLSDKLGYIDADRLTRLMDALDRFENMSVEQKELIKLVVNK